MSRYEYHIAELSLAKIDTDEPVVLKEKFKEGYELISVIVIKNRVRYYFKKERTS